MIPGEHYNAEQAVTDLKIAGLLHAVLLPGQTGMTAHNSEEISPKDVKGFFKGAGLDSRTLSKPTLFVALAGENVDGRDYAAQALTAGNWVLTRTLSHDETDPLLNTLGAATGGALLCDDPELALAHLAACWRRRLDLEIVAVTGTNGKTTTKDFIRSMLSEAGKTQATPGNLNNQLGLPLTLLNLDHDTKYAVIEMGASAVGDIHYLAEITAPDVGVITNAAEAHLELFGSLANIISGKGELLDSLSENGVAVLNADSPGYDQWKNRAQCQVVSWGRSIGEHTWSWGYSESSSNDLLLLDGDSWPLLMPGRHNAANLCAAVLACRALGLDDSVLRKGLESFSASDHRGSLLNWKGRIILDDSYNANPASLLAAIISLTELLGDGRTIAMIGAMAELGSDSIEIHQKSGKEIAQTDLNILIAVGENSFPLADGFNLTSEADSHQLPGFQDAADWLNQNSKPGDRILIKGSRSSAMENIIKKLGL